MKKYWKWLLAIVATGTAAGLIIAHFLKKNNEAEDLDEFDDDDFDLDVDLQPVSEREYVSLKKAETETEEPETNSDEVETDSDEKEAEKEPEAADEEE